MQNATAKLGAHCRCQSLIGSGMRLQAQAVVVSALACSFTRHQAVRSCGLRSGGRQSVGGCGGALPPAKLRQLRRRCWPTTLPTWPPTCALQVGPGSHTFSSSRPNPTRNKPPSAAGTQRRQPVPRQAMAQRAAAGSAAGGPLPPLVSADWLKEHLHDVKVLDAAWYLPVQGGWMGGHAGMRQQRAHLLQRRMGWCIPQGCSGWAFRRAALARLGGLCWAGQMSMTWVAAVCRDLRR